MADFGLANAVDAAEALLDAIGVPRQIVIDHQVSALKVDAFARGVGGGQDLDFWIVEERFLRLFPLLAAHPAVDENHGVFAAKNRADLLL